MAEYGDLPIAEVILVDTAQLSPTPLLEIGGEGAMPLHLIRAGILLGDGNVAVMTEGSRSILVFDRQGTLTRELGRAGDGPGEFRLPRDAGSLSDGSIVAWDMGSGRVTRFDPSGQVSTLSIPTGQQGFRATQVRWLSDHRSVVVRTRRLRSRPRGLSSDSAMIAVMAEPPTSLERIVGVFAATEWYRGGGGTFVAPMRRRGVHVVARDSTILIGFGEQPLLLEVGLDGTPVRRWLLPIERVPLTDDTGDAERTRFLSQFSPPEFTESDLEQLASDFDQALGTVDSLPAFDQLVPASSGHFWVGLPARTHDSKRSWLVVNPQRLEASIIRLPAGAVPLDATDSAVLVSLVDAMDREIVRVHDFTSPQWTSPGMTDTSTVVR